MHTVQQQCKVNRFCSVNFCELDACTIPDYTGACSGSPQWSLLIVKLLIFPYTFNIIYGPLSNDYMFMQESEFNTVMGYVDVVSSSTRSDDHMGMGMAWWYLWQSGRSGWWGQSCFWNIFWRLGALNPEIDSDVTDDGSTENKSITHTVTFKCIGTTHHPRAQEVLEKVSLLLDIGVNVPVNLSKRRQSTWQSSNCFQVLPLRYWLLKLHWLLKLC